MRHALPFVLLLALGACATAAPPPAPVERQRVVAAPLAVVLDRLRTAMAGLGLTVTSPTASTLVGNGAASGGADCEVLVVWDRDNHNNRADFAHPGQVNGEVQARVEPASGGSRVDLQSAFTGSYRDIFTNLPLTHPCRSTGQLEKRLLDAAQGS